MAGPAAAADCGAPHLTLTPGQAGVVRQGPRDLASLHTAQPRQDTAWRSGGHTAAAGAGV